MKCLALSLLLSCVLSVQGSEQSNGTVYIIDGQPRFKAGIDKEGLSYGVFKDGLMESGWGVLDLKTSAKGSSFEDLSNVMFAAGYLEGYLTHEHIYNQYMNIRGYFLKKLTPEGMKALKQFITKQELYIASGRMSHPGDQLWETFTLIYSQYNGLKQGYNAAAPKDKQLEDFAFVILNWSGDLLDLISAVVPSSRPDFDKMNNREFFRYITANSHCSALIKILPGYENIFFSHSSWFMYQATNRIFKYYDLDIPFAASRKLSFSSYPGFLESLDDFYMMGNGLIMLQTTNNVFNMSLYDLVHPNTVPAWIRVRAANMLSRNASEWGELLRRENSGTYNNQYMVLDLNKVRINETIEDHALYVVEQIPGLVENEDQTEILRNGHWPSYNVPFYESVYNRSGYPAQVKKQGLDTSYQLAPRAKIFRRDAATVADMKTMKHIMRFNDYKKDLYSEGDPCKTICCRGDLEENDARSMGCYDSKVSDYYMASQQMVWAINGPSLGDGTLDSFNWNQFKNQSHIGLPQNYNFDWMTIKPIL